MPPYTVEQDSLYFQSFNRNKKSITLNLKHPRARDVLLPLVALSEGVFNNLRGDLPARLGLDFAALKEVKPSIVCCSLSAFGRDGPRAAEPGYDYVMQGYAGWMSITGEPGMPPIKTGLSLVDYSAGVIASVGLISAILRARETGLGCDVDVNLFDTALSQLGYLASWHLTKGYQPAADARFLPPLPNSVPNTADPRRVVGGNVRQGEVLP